MKTSRNVASALATALIRLLRPLARILLSNGVAFDAFVDVAKRAYVDVAMRDFEIPGKKQTISRVSVLTGLTRKEVQRVLHEPSDAEADTSERYHRAARVIGGWRRDRKFRTSAGKPQDLAFDGVSKSFAELVRRYSGDMPPRAVLDELLRVGAVRRMSNGRLRLLVPAYVPRSSNVDKIGILGADAADLIHTINHNLEHSGREPRFQRKVMYDNLPAEAVEEFRRLSAAQSQQLLECLDGWLVKRDRDVSPNVKGRGRFRAGIGIYYFEEDLRGGSEEKLHEH
jgi:hypothetical protein